MRYLTKALGQVVAAFVVSTVSHAAPDDAVLDEAREAIARQAMARAGVVGASIVLIEDHKIVWAQGFGVRGPDGVPVTPQTEFEAASNGKIMGAFVVMQLIEEGALTLETPLEDARLATPEGCAAPTVSHALSHTTGLGNNLGAETLEPSCAPGATFAYAGQGYMVLQSMLERQSGRSLDQLMTDRIFEPLGLTSAAFTPETTPGFATGYIDLVFGMSSHRASAAMLNLARGIAIALLAVFLVVAWKSFKRYRRLVAIPLIVVSLPIFFGVFVLILASITTPVARATRGPDLASSLQLNAVDLATFALELLDPKLLGGELREAMFAEQIRINERISWADGIGIDRSDGHTTYWHWGSNPGFQSLFVIEPETGNGIVIMTNTGGFLDHLTQERGGGNMSKDIARQLLEIDGAWDLRGYR